jgi:hypothetical protein
MILPDPNDPESMSKFLEWVEQEAQKAVDELHLEQYPTVPFDSTPEVVPEEEG